VQAGVRVHTVQRDHVAETGITQSRVQAGVHVHTVLRLGTITQSRACLTITLSAIGEQPEARSTSAVMSDVSKDALVCTSTVINMARVHYTHSQDHYLNKEPHNNLLLIMRYMTKYY